MRQCRCNGGWGFAAIALGIGVLIAALCPEGALLLIIAILLIICGTLCMRRR